MSTEQCKAIVNDENANHNSTVTFPSIAKPESQSPMPTNQQKLSVEELGTALKNSGTLTVDDTEMKPVEDARPSVGTQTPNVIDTENVSTGTAHNIQASTRRSNGPCRIHPYSRSTTNNLRLGDMVNSSALRMFANERNLPMLTNVGYQNIVESVRNARARRNEWGMIENDYDSDSSSDESGSLSGRSSSMSMRMRYPFPEEEEESESEDDEEEEEDNDDSDNEDH